MSWKQSTDSARQQPPIYTAIFCSLTWELKHSVSLVLKRSHLTQLISSSRRHNKKKWDAAVGSSWAVAHSSWSTARGLKHAASLMMVISFCWGNVLSNCEALIANSNTVYLCVCVLVCVRVCTFLMLHNISMLIVIIISAFAAEICRVQSSKKNLSP